MTNRQRKTPEHIKVVVKGVSYNDVRSAWRDVSPKNLPEITVRKRLEAGWDADDAFLTPPIPAELRRKGHEEL